MPFTTTTSSIRTIHSDDPKFQLRDGIYVGQRAGFEISQSCPKDYKDIILHCISNGWVRPVACMHDYEMTFAILKD
jgi:hypothetical protein